ncbi:hypothetical protein POM88_012485 [Heracleum sosnowskyi]|uniref:PHD finger protein ALFIN-LIKE n=1 Tax=Heracleum sosnowskyi TaxID=360622 RepID=A0AAD8IWK9_9APIA|nr:hypothetical protein POM88_012485 [Heracleum sosnowskyi]
MSKELDFKYAYVDIGFVKDNKLRAYFNRFQVKLKTNVAAFAAGFRANSKELQNQANGDGKPATGAKTTGTEVQNEEPDSSKRQCKLQEMKVNFPEVPRGGEREVMGPKIRSSYQSFVDSPHKLYAGNLSWSVTSQQLKEFFADQPGLLSAKVIYDRQSGRSQGYGFITFESADLCLYGLPNEKWEVNLPVEEVPPEMPEPALGINFSRDGMQEKDRLSLVAVHSDSWLLSVAFYFGARFGFGKNDRASRTNINFKVFVVAMTENEAASNSVPPAPILLPQGPWKQIRGGVTAAKGFKATGMYGGLCAK